MVKEVDGLKVYDCKYQVHCEMYKGRKRIGKVGERRGGGQTERQ